MTGALAGQRIGLLTASASRLGGGVAEAVIVQNDMIRSLGGQPLIFALADRHSEEDRARFAPSEVHFSKVTGPAQVGFAPDLVRSLIGARLDCLHLHGLWMYPSRAGALWARASGKPYLISPHGMLDPWITGRSRLKKAVAKLLYERDSWRRATVFHALTVREAGDIARQSGRTDSLEIANAGPPLSPPVQRLRAPHIVYLGRIHPKKNLIALVQAWAQLDPGGNARLTIAGWGDESCLAELEAALAVAPKSARFVGPVYGKAKQDLLESARFTVLPSLSEGLPMALLEGWAAGTPAIMSAECNISEAFAAGAALDSGYGADSIAKALKAGLDIGEEHWLAMTASARKLAAGPFSAGEIAFRWSKAYQRLLFPSATVKGAQSDAHS